MVVIVILVLVLVFLYMRPMRKGKREEFAQNVEQDYKDSISKVFLSVLGRDPAEYEVTLYREFMKNPYDTNDIRTKLLESSEYKETEKFVAKPICQEEEHYVDMTKERLAIYKKVIQVYEKDLDRLPTSRELDYYTNKISSEDIFTVEKLSIILQSSKEYDILQKNQTNVVAGQLEGEITDAQLTLIVNDIYNSLFSAKPTEQFEDFMKTKYIEYKFNDEKFKRMLKLLANIDTETDPYSGPLSSAGLPEPPSKGIEKVTQDEIVTKDGSRVVKVAQESDAINYVMQESVDKMLTSKSIGNTISNSQGSKNNVVAQPMNNQVQAGSSTTMASVKDNHYMTIGNGSCPDVYAGNNFTDSLYNNMKAVQSGDFDTCKETKNVGLAEFLNKRNQNELAYQCARTSYFSGLEGDLKEYDPNINLQYKNTRFGTFLEEADNTKIGSILPKFIFKEYC
jgi:hypothetical protein